jgi:hypothetical protein
MDDKTGSAFPSQQGECQDGTWNQTFDPGMTLRDWFAGQALAQSVEDYDRTETGHPAKQGERVLAYATGSHTGTRVEIIARQAYRYADAMLKARQ